jgi:hypothetical protein
MNEALGAAYDVPRFFPAINILEKLLEFMTFQFFSALEDGHDLLFQPLPRGVVVVLRPPPPGLHKESEPGNGVVHFLPVLNLLSRTIGKRIVGGGMMPNTARFQA